MKRYYKNRKIAIQDVDIETVNINGESTEDWVIVKTGPSYYLVVDNVLDSDEITYE